ncbi:MAG: 30S ribosomal protein S12 methylthiotransferase RimO [Verrucomicrobia bacterium]|nr:30S ribosomal protein S12 methylthiotransferase RimO [Verrucomicrobiota bacterium]
MISLGCAKNLVDAEVMLGDVLAHGMRITSNAEEADVLIVNTCAFIDSAKEESIDAVLEAHQNRGLAKRAGQKLIVSGCMAQRFAKDLAKDLPEVDAFIGLDQVGEVSNIVRAIMDRGNYSPLNLVTPKSRYIPDYTTPRFRLTPPHYAYLKIAEGCNHPCSFCVIPQMRGRHRSRSMDSIEAEIRNLVDEGVKEINLISQDTTYYGMDLWDQKAGPRQPIDSTRGPTLSRLLQRIEDIPGEFWIRLLYTHPAHWSHELICTIAASSKVVRYIDMPLQHIDEGMLNLMRRETSRQHIEDLIAAIREGIPGIALRTTFIVGFPGETEQQFNSLLEFIQRMRFERLGIFAYSREDGSRAAKMDGQLSKATKNRRYKEAMKLQQTIANENAIAQIGLVMRGLVDQPMVARSAQDAPEVDTRILLNVRAPVGQFVDIQITGSQIYDLKGDIADGQNSRGGRNGSA